MLFDDIRSPDLTPEALLLGAAPLGNALAPPTVPLLKNSGTIDLSLATLLHPREAVGFSGAVRAV